MSRARMWRSNTAGRRGNTTECRRSRAVKAATTTIPIVFTAAADPVSIGLVASLSRPGGNVTGVTQLHEVVAPKRLELAHQLMPTATMIAVLVNPTYPGLELR